MNVQHKNIFIQLFFFGAGQRNMNDVFQVQGVPKKRSFVSVDRVSLTNAPDDDKKQSDMRN